VARRGLERAVFQTLIHAVLSAEVIWLPSINFRSVFPESLNPRVSGGFCWDEFHFPDDRTLGGSFIRLPLVFDHRLREF